MDDVLALGDVVEVDQAGVQPLVVGMLGGEVALDLLVLDDPVLVGVDEEHPARLEPALADDAGGVEVEDSDLGGEDDEAVVGDPVAARAQAVAVEHGADLGAVGEHDARRPVPRLHQHGVELVERPPLRVHLLVVLPGLGDHHQDRVGQGPAAHVEQLEDLVEARGVGGARRTDREEAVEVAGDQVGVEQRLAGPHPVAVAHHGVDLAVVGDVAERVGQRPAREGVGREAGVHDGQRRGDPLVGQVGEEPVELVGGEHALVEQGARAQRAEVDLGLALGPLAQAEGAALQRHAGQAGTGSGEEQLAEQRHHAAGGRAEQAQGRPVRRASRGRSAPRPRRAPRPAAGSWRPRRRHPRGTPCRRRTRRARGGRSRRPRAGRRRGPGAGCRRRRRSSPRRPPHRGGRGCAAPSAPSTTMSWLASPVSVATKATPQASCSKRGSYSPWAGGPACIARIDRCSRRRCRGRPGAGGRGKFQRARQGGRGRRWPKRGQASKWSARSRASSCPADRRGCRRGGGTP